MLCSGSIKLETKLSDPGFTNEALMKPRRTFTPEFKVEYFAEIKKRSPTTLRNLIKIFIVAWLHDFNID